MSIQTLKKKGVINYGSNRSGCKGTANFIQRGPFGTNSTVVSSGCGFSLEGAHRNVGYVGKTYCMSKQGTQFIGQFPRGYGGYRSQYYQAQPLYNALEAIVLGNQFEYVKPSVLSTKGMLETKYKYLFTRGYPHSWTQNTFTGNQTDSSSQLLYIQTKAAQNVCVNNTNKPQKFVNYYRVGGPLGCATSMGKLDYKIVSSNAGYTKDLGIPQDASQYTLQVQRKCANPTGDQLPFPFNTPPTSSNSGSGINYAPPSVYKINYLRPPLWYTQQQKT